LTRPLLLLTLHLPLFLRRTATSHRLSCTIFFNLLRSPGIDYKELIPPAYAAWRAGTSTLFLLGSKPSIDSSKIPACLTCTHFLLPHGTRAGIFRQSMGARNRVGRGLSYRPARLHRLAESISWNQFLGSRKVYKYQLNPTFSVSNPVLVPVPPPEAEFLDVIGTKVIRVFLLAIYSHLY
jgi:hypothetical protein